MEFGLVAVVTLVDGGELEKVGSWTNGGGASLRAPGDCRGVVGHGTGCKVVHWDLGCKDVVVGNGTSEFEVAVGDGAQGMLEGDQFVLDVLWKRGTPKDGRLELVLGVWLQG